MTEALSVWLALCVSLDVPDELAVIVPLDVPLAVLLCEVLCV